MTGRQLRSKLKESGFEMKNIAGNMGISPQALNSKLNAVSIKTDFVEQLAMAINTTVYELLSDKDLLNGHPKKRNGKRKPDDVHKAIAELASTFATKKELEAIEAKLKSLSEAVQQLLAKQQL